MKVAIVGACIFDGYHFHEDSAVLIDRGVVWSLVDSASIPQDFEIKELDGGILAPGFIDLQVNGGGGAFFTNEATEESLYTMLNGHRLTGTTSMLPTLISDSREVHQAGVNAVRKVVEDGCAGILGIHIEGPFFSLEKRGAHKEQYIRKIDDEDLSWLRSISDIKVMLTLAPEMLEPEQIRTLTQSGITVCAGHTNANYEEVARAIEEGLSGFTHLFNGMSNLTGRSPCAVGAALESKDTWCGVIADNHHVHPASIRVALNAKPKGKVYLVSDSMATVGSKNKSFQLYGETIKEKDGALVNSAGSLAGSAIGMIDAVRIAHQSVGIDLSEALRMASLYPAQFMQFDAFLGYIKNGYRADLVHFSENFVVKNTWVAGQHLHHA